MYSFLGQLLLLIAIFIGIRNSYTYEKMDDARKAIHKMDMELIELGWIGATQDNYQLMKFSYNRYLLSFWLWGKLSVIKPQYRDILEPYFD